jgi:hypothetical protein
MNMLPVAFATNGAVVDEFTLIALKPSMFPAVAVNKMPPEPAEVVLPPTPIDAPVTETFPAAFRFPLPE